MTLTDKLHEVLVRNGIADQDRQLARLLAGVAAKHTSNAMRKGVQKQKRDEYENRLQP